MRVWNLTVDLKQYYNFQVIYLSVKILLRGEGINRNSES